MPAKATRRCAARGCKTFVPRRQLMCRDHWYMVPGEIRREVNVAYAERGSRPAAPMTPRYAAAVRSAIDAVAEIEAATARRLATIAEHVKRGVYLIPFEVLDLPPMTDAERAAQDRQALELEWRMLPAAYAGAFTVKVNGDVADMVEHAARQPKPECKLDIVATDEQPDGRIAAHFLCQACGMTKTIIYDVNECATCNRKGGTIEGDMQGDEHMTAYVEWFSPCDDCLSNGLCPSCGNATLIADVYEAAMNDISTFICPICGWQFERDRFDYEPDYD